MVYVGLEDIVHECMTISLSLDRSPSQNIELIGVPFDAVVAKQSRRREEGSIDLVKVATCTQKST